MKILLADDEPIVRRGLKQMIKNLNFSFAAVLEAATGQEAIALTGRYRPEIILLDVKMPGLDGIAAAQKIKQVNPQTRIIFLTAYARFDYARAAVRCGAKDYLVKPVHPDELKRAIGACLEELSAVRPSAAGPDVGLTRPRQFVKSAAAYILQNYMKPLTLEEVARQVHLSPAYFSYLFRREQGRTFTDYLTATRLDKAKELLRTDPSLSISEVAGQVGYEDANYFSRLFKKKTGLTPARYRKKEIERR
ncbi:MAG TPA: response regulator [Syntrophomonadaceae bacterium]|nr:response regulator [Syntrophomonadaceae bacterium]